MSTVSQKTNNGMTFRTSGEPCLEQTSQIVCEFIVAKTAEKKASSSTIVEDVTNRNEKNAKINEVVSKAKKAADSLWIILHAQNCSNYHCSFRGCTEAKRILLHIKTCPSTHPSCSCPKNFRGCNQTRKLLAHYRKCKEDRVKEKNNSETPRIYEEVNNMNTNSCLICSFLARRARNIFMEKNQRNSQMESKAVPKTKQGQTLRSNIAISMPPPPPRNPLNTNREVLQRERSLSFSITREEKKRHPVWNNCGGTLPSNSRYRRRSVSLDESVLVSRPSAIKTRNDPTKLELFLDKNDSNGIS